MNIRWILCVAVAIVVGCTGQKPGAGPTEIRGRIDPRTLFSWLPADTETLQVANGPFWMSNFVTGRQDDKDREVTSEELEKQFEGLTLGLFDFDKDFLGKHLDGKKVLFALEGSRHFRPPKGLGELPFEGCAVAIFQEDLEDRRDAFMRDAVGVATRIEQIQGQKVAEFEEQIEQDTWTFFVTFPQKGVVLVSTNKQFLQEMLARMLDAEGQRALPDSLREWKYVNQTAQFWGLRHYDEQQAKNDPTSPFEGRKSANFPDEEAVGLTYECNPRAGLRVSVTYITGQRAEASKIAADRFPDTGDPKLLADLHITFQELTAGVIRSTFDLHHSRAAELFFFIFMDHLGHAVYV
jgi:hypothetical protein